ncbi:MAG: hypothetical protein ACXIUD_12255 [Mongoliitalea sp.]
MRNIKKQKDSHKWGEKPAIENNMKNLFVWMLSLFLFTFNINSQQYLPKERIFIVIPRNNIPDSKISYAEHKTTLYGAIITFDTPNFSASAFHVPSRNNHPDYRHEEIWVSQSELQLSSLVFAEDLTFNDWENLEKNRGSKKYYLIFKEDYLSNNRFILNFKYRALEVEIHANGPI